MGYLYLIIAGIFEIGWAIGLKQLDTDKTGFPWIIVFFVSVIGSIGFLDTAIKTIPIGVAYAIFTAVGAIGTTVIGIYFFNESTHWLRILFFISTIISVIGLKYSSNLF
jgi:quaternary ammonium compound-resistance protein SugE